VIRNQLLAADHRHLGRVEPVLAGADSAHGPAEDVAKVADTDLPQVAGGLAPAVGGVGARVVVEGGDTAARLLAGDAVKFGAGTGQGEAAAAGLVPGRCVADLSVARAIFDAPWKASYGGFGGFAA
jgi:hypothetical protein